MELVAYAHVTVVALTYDRLQCGVSDYIAHLYPHPDCLGADVVVRKLKLTFWNALRIPFLRADVIHLQHEYSLLGFAGCWGFLLLLWLQLLRLRRSRLAVTLHTIYDWDRTAEIFSHRTKSRLVLRALKVYGKAYHRLILNTVNLLIFVSEPSRKIFEAKNRIPRRVRQAVIPIGVYDAAGPRPAPAAGQSGRLGIAASDFVFTLFGFAYPNKGYHLVIEALDQLRPRLPKLRLLVVSGEPAEGGKGYLNELREQVRSLNLGERVFFTGYLPGGTSRYAEVLDRTDCFLYPYVRESAASGSLATTLAARKLYITSDLEMFRPFTPAIKFNAGDARHLALTMTRVMDMSTTEVVARLAVLDDYIAANGVQAMRQHHAEVFREMLK